MEGEDAGVEEERERQQPPDPPEADVQEEHEELKGLLEKSTGGCPVELVLSLGDGAEATLDLVGLKVTPSDSVLSGLERMFGETVAELR